jgi:hypothetical protein
MYIPREQGGPVLPMGHGFHFVASYDLQDYGGGILTRPHMGSSTSAAEQSYVTTDGRSVSISLCRAYSGLVTRH